MTRERVDALALEEGAQLAPARHGAGDDVPRDERDLLAQLDARPVLAGELDADPRPAGQHVRTFAGLEVAVGHAHDVGLGIAAALFELRRGEVVRIARVQDIINGGAKNASVSILDKLLGLVAGNQWIIWHVKPMHLKLGDRLVQLRACRIDVECHNYTHLMQLDKGAEFSEGVHLFLICLQPFRPKS